MEYRYKQILWLAGFFIVVLSLFAGAAMGGVAGYIAAKELASPAQPVPATTPPETLLTDAERPVSVASPAATGEQPLVVTEQSASTETVEKVLPAVVTVVNQGRQGIGSGSGFFINEEGYVVTNNHVIAGADNLLVIYAQGGTAEAELVGTAPEFDLAVLKESVA
jgi:putative serine protease PepD